MGAVSLSHYKAEHDSSRNERKIVEFLVNGFSNREVAPSGMTDDGVVRTIPSIPGVSHKNKSPPMEFAARCHSSKAKQFEESLDLNSRIITGKMPPHPQEGNHQSFRACRIADCLPVRSIVICRGSTFVAFLA